MKFQFNDGGRSAAGYQGKTGDCVARAIAIVTGKPYQEVYDALNALIQSKRQTKRMRGKSARTGVPHGIDREYLLSIGAKWVPTMAIGQGCKVHLKAGELPSGRLLVAVSKHLTAVVDGVIHDTYDPSRNGTRCVYGYYVFPHLDKSLTTRESRSCENPLCNTSIETLTQGWRRTERRFCSDHCRTDAWALRRAAALLIPVGKDKAWEILSKWGVKS